MNVNDADDSIYVTVSGASTPKRLTFRFSNHPIPEYKDPALRQKRQVDYRVDPQSSGSLDGAMALIQSSF